MPNIKSAKKRVLIAEVNNQRNKSYRSALKSSIKKANDAVESGASDKEDCVKAAAKKIDQATVKGILHKNTAARKKSALALSLNKS